MRSCRFGIGKSCCHRGRRAFPVSFLVSDSSLTYYTMSSGPSMCLIRTNRPCRGSQCEGVGYSYLSGIYLLTREGIVVGTHLD